MELRKILENFYIIFFLFFIGTIFILNIFIKDKEFSEYENRTLQLFPKITISKIFDGTFQSEFDTYTSDQMVFKNSFVKGKNYLEILQMKLEVNGVYNASNDFYIERHPNDEYNLELLEKNVNSALKFKEKYNSEIYLVPTANQILTDKIFLTNDFNYNKYMKNIENIDFVDNILKNYNDNKSDLYYKTDHHWTTIGAYELYKNIVENPIILNLEIVDKEFYGTINNKLNISMKPDIIYKQKSNTNFSVYYDMGKQNLGLYFDKYLDTKDKYSYFLDSNHGLIQITNEDIESTEKLLIIKDSYANCFIPFIAENYKQTDVIDLRYFNMPISNFLNMYNYDRIIILYNKHSFATDENIFKLTY